MNANLQNIGRACIKSPGNVREIILVQPEDVQAKPEYFIDPVVANLTLKSNTNTYYIQQDLFTGRFRERKRNDRGAGDYFEQSLALEIRKDRIEVKRNLIRMINARCHILFSDYVGGWKWLKNMRENNGFDTGSGISASQKYDFNFTGKSRKPSPWLENTVPDSTGDPSSSPVTINQLGGGGTVPVCEPQRLQIGVQTGGTFNLPVGAPDDLSRIWVYIEGSLIAWNRGLTRNGNICTVEPPLQAEFVEVIYF